MIDKFGVNESGACKSGDAAKATAAGDAKQPYDAKRSGDIAELAFILKATSMGITASKPYGDRRPYDFLVEHGQRLLRIQVKSVFVKASGGRRYGFSVPVSKNHRNGRIAYSAEEIDFLVAFVVPHNAWYVIPVEVLCGRLTANFYPAGKKRCDAGLYEHYREAWHLLKAL